MYEFGRCLESKNTVGTWLEERVWTDESSIRLIGMSDSVLRRGKFEVIGFSGLKGIFYSSLFL